MNRRKRHKVQREKHKALLGKVIKEARAGVPSWTVPTTSPEAFERWQLRRANKR